MRKVDVEALREQLLSKIDTADLKEVEKVERYCDLIEIVQDCRAKVKDEGPSIKIINGKQEFTKSHPCMNDIAKFNAQIIALEKSMIFKLKADIPVPSPSSSVGGKNKRGGLI
ncbi:P27 family phage terminase small subunit [Lysinibacillus sp. G4S2]|uniref:P27 family phage terminase small subunit n=1 Tax=Lysinibacillus sp. G4S2 TaxID=3055859 RepID=UPI00259FF777|nr:P27 family phage terminase small subunit [Lysinibacillus sp. G4S2]MDM5245751.1 terminase [Lysinibacillus sp. G4S2]